MIERERERERDVKYEWHFWVTCALDSDIQCIRTVHASARDSRSGYCLPSTDCCFSSLKYPHCSAYRRVCSVPSHSSWGLRGIALLALRFVKPSTRRPTSRNPRWSQSTSSLDASVDNQSTHFAFSHETVTAQTKGLGPWRYNSFGIWRRVDAGGCLYLQGLSS